MTNALLATDVNAQARSGYHTGKSYLDLRQQLGIEKISIDSTENQGQSTPDTASLVTNTKSPLMAVLLSAVPGGGQIYNGSYWKVPIIWGVQAFFVTQWIYNNKQYRSYRSQFADSLAAGPPFDQSTSQRQYYLVTLETIRDAYRDQRDSFAWYMAGVYVLSMVDAYVDAELSGFNVSPNLSATPAGPTLTVTLSVKF